MAWETRKGRGRYYTRSVRQDGRVVRQYLGSGGFVEALADLEEVEGELRALERAEEQERRREERGLEEAVTNFCSEVEDVLRAALEAAGYHRHARGAWRKRRERAGQKAV